MTDCLYDCLDWNNTTPNINQLALDKLTVDYLRETEQASVSVRCNNNTMFGQTSSLDVTWPITMTDCENNQSIFMTFQLILLEKFQLIFLVLMALVSVIVTSSILLMISTDFSTELSTELFREESIWESDDGWLNTTSSYRGSLWRRRVPAAVAIRQSTNAGGDPTGDPEAVLGRERVMLALGYLSPCPAMNWKTSD